MLFIMFVCLFVSNPSPSPPQPSEWHKLMVIKSNAPPNPNSIHGALICKLGLRVITALTPPVIKLFSQNKWQEPLRQWLRFPCFSVRINEWHHGKEAEGKLHVDAAASLADHPALKSQTFTESSITGEPWGHAESRISIYSRSPTLISPLSSIRHCIRRRSQRAWSGCCSHQSSNRLEKCCSLSGSAASNRWMQQFRRAHMNKHRGNTKRRID